MAQKYNINAVRGDTFKINFKLKTADDNPIELGADDKLFFTIKNRYSDEDFILNKTLEDMTKEDDSYKLLISSVETSEFKMDVPYVYDVEYIQNYSTDRITTTLLIGNITFTKEVTRYGNE